MFRLLKIFVGLGFHVCLFAGESRSTSPHAPEHYREMIGDLGVELLGEGHGLEGFLEKRGPALSWAFLSRPETISRYISLVRRLAPGCPVLYDTVDIHWVRFERASELNGEETQREKSEKYRQWELSGAAMADMVITVTENDREHLLKEMPDLRVEIIPNIHEVKVKSAAPGNRQGLLFIGGFHHRPNVDAMVYFVKEIFPLVRRDINGIRLHIVGSHPQEEIRALASYEVSVTGYVENVSPFFNGCRVFVSPLRYGSGMKGKIGQSMAYGLPVVTTGIGAEGMELIDGENALVADDPEAFAAAVIRLCRDDRLWMNVSKNSLEHIRARFSPEVVAGRVRKIIESIRPC